MMKGIKIVRFYCKQISGLRKGKPIILVFFLLFMMRLKVPDRNQAVPLERRHR
jgi:hypothetical protein